VANPHFVLEKEKGPKEEFVALMQEVLSKAFNIGPTAPGRRLAKDSWPHTRAVLSVVFKGRESKYSLSCGLPTFDTSLIK